MNLVVYVFDALRADHLSCYGYDRNTSPNIDEIASEGIQYQRCFSPSTWTKPVGASLLTGAYPPTHGTRTRADVFDTEIRRLPQELDSSVDYSIGFSTMGNVSASIGYDKGFDEFQDLYKDDDIIENRQTHDTSSEELDHENAEEIALPRAEDLTQRFGSWVKQQSFEDFFAFCWSIETHMPYTPPAGFREFTDSDYTGPVNGKRESLPKIETDKDLDYLRSLYDGGIKYNDTEFGKMMDSLKSLGIYDETAIVVLGDHGDAFNEHGRLTHGHLPYDELIHVPLIIKPAASMGMDSCVVDEIVSLVDVFPTILDLFDIDDTPDTVEGRALPPFGPNGTSAPVFSETRSRDVYPSFYSVRTENWKYMEVDQPDKNAKNLFKTFRQLHERNLISNIIRNPVYYLKRYLHSEDEFLYDLNSDPDENKNLINKKTKKAIELQNQLQDWISTGEKRHESLSNSDTGGIDDKTSEQLKRLGYVD